MRKLAEIKDENAITIWGELFEPITALLADKELADIIKSGAPILKWVKPMTKHPKEIIKIISILEGKPENELNINIMTLPQFILQLINDKFLLDFFRSQGLNSDVEHSGSVTENIAETAVI